MVSSPRRVSLKAFAAAVLLLGAGIATGWWLRQPGAVPASVSDTGNARPVLYWYDPMVPQQHFDKPGKSPFMDMQLVPRYADEPSAAGDAAATGIVVSAATQQHLGMRLATVQPIEHGSEIHATGTLAWSERDVAIVQARAAGFVRAVRSMAPGDPIAAGQSIAELVLPEWTAAEHEWLVVQASSDVSLKDAARQRLLQLGIDADEVRRLEREGVASDSFAVRASQAGVIQSVDIRDGMSVMPGQTLLRIVGTAVVWLDIAVPEALIESVQVGDEVLARSAAMPTVSFKGRVAAVLPALDAVSRTLPVRVELPNRAGRLRPGLSVQVTLQGRVPDAAVAVPTEAVIRTGRRALVMLEDNGAFRPIEVTLGSEVGDQTIIASGLEAGQRVVASGQFLLDSEASLRGLTAPMPEAQP